MNQVALLLLPMLALVPCPDPQDGARTGTNRSIRVLFIGNSYTRYNKLTTTLEALAGTRHQVETEQITNGGFTLARHLSESGIEETLRQAERAGRRFDWVVLQEQSTLPIRDKKRMHAAARKIARLVTNHGAKTLFFVTWARAGRPRMQDGLNAAYEEIAKATGARVAHVGNAWKLSQAKRGELVLHAEDGSHPTAAGSYLAACVLHFALIGQPVFEPQTWLPPDVTAGQASFLRKTAARIGIDHELKNENVTKLLSRETRDAGFRAILEDGRHRGEGVYEEEGNLRVRHVVVCPQRRGPPLFAVFAARGRGVRLDGMAKGHIVVVASDGAIIRFYKGANHISGELDDLNGDGTIECIDSMRYGLSRADESLDVSELFVLPIAERMRPSLRIAFNPARGSTKWTWEVRIDPKTRTKRIVLGPGKGKRVDEAKASWHWSTDRRRWMGPNGGPGKRFLRIGPGGDDALMLFARSAR